MSSSATATVEIDLELLERLRERRPEQSDRGREAFAGTSSEEIDREAVKAAREVRAERAAARQATG